MDKTITKTLFWLALTLTLPGCGGGGGGGGSVERIVQDISGNWTIPQDEVADGGPGKDGIPAIDTPLYIDQQSAIPRKDDEFVIGLVDSAGARAIPHDIMNWHEILNDQLDGSPVTLSYCPLTGSTLLWEAESNINPEFGVSGLLYKSNLILYDRNSDSHWVQMLQRAVEGQRVGETRVSLPVIETRWSTWVEMYPETTLLSRRTGFTREYDSYPYGDYLTSNRLLFPVSPRDNRLHEKERVLGVSLNNQSRVYRISQFMDGIDVINDVLGGEPIVVIGSRDKDLGIAFHRQVSDGTILEFNATALPLPAVMTDNEGNTWNVHGVATAGPREGEQLRFTDSFIAFWFAWVAFFAGTEIHGQ